MKILILGSDGYIGYPLTIHLLRKGHEVFGVDNLSRRRRVKEIGNSLTPITPAIYRKSYLRKTFPNFIDQVDISLGTDAPGYIKSVLNSFKPDAIVHLAEMPSAPWSMRDVNYAHHTQLENVIGTLDLLWAIKEECPNAHLVKLGTLGEYGTPKCDIPEGRIPNGCLGWSGDLFDQQFECPMSGLLFPRTPGSFYHVSKVMDTLNIEFSCRNWGLRSTDIMQGVVFGLTGDTEDELTRFDYDECFGTVLNRFCVQALINHPLTVYGKGNQTRGFLTLNDSIICLTIALENPPNQGEYRTLNQFENIYKVNDLAQMVCEGAITLGYNPSIDHLSNPRKEAEEHYYNPTHETLFNLGYVPTTNIQAEITSLIRQLEPYKERIITEVIMPEINWR